MYRRDASLLYFQLTLNILCLIPFRLDLFLKLIPTPTLLLQSDSNFKGLFMIIEVAFQGICSRQKEVCIRHKKLLRLLAQKKEAIDLLIEFYTYLHLWLLITSFDGKIFSVFLWRLAQKNARISPFLKAPVKCFDLVFIKPADHKSRPKKTS